MLSFNRESGGGRHPPFKLPKDAQAPNSQHMPFQKTAGMMLQGHLDSSAVLPPQQKVLSPVEEMRVGYIGRVSKKPLDLPESHLFTCALNEPQRASTPWDFANPVRSVVRRPDKELGRSGPVSVNYLRNVRRRAQERLPSTARSVTTQLADLQTLATSNCRAGRLDAAAEMYYRMGVVLDNSGDTEGSLDAYYKFLGLSIATGNATSQGLAHNCLGINHFRLGNLDAAVQHHNKHLSLADLAGKFAAHSNLGLIFQSLDLNEHAAVHHQHAVECGLKLNSKVAQSVAVGNLGISSFKQGDSATARLCMLFHLKHHAVKPLRKHPPSTEDFYQRILNALETRMHPNSLQQKDKEEGEEKRRVQIVTADKSPSGSSAASPRYPSSPLVKSTRSNETAEKEKEGHSPAGRDRDRSGSPSSKQNLPWKLNTARSSRGLFPPVPPFLPPVSQQPDTLSSPALPDSTSASAPTASASPRITVIPQRPPSLFAPCPTRPRRQMDPQTRSTIDAHGELAKVAILDGDLNEAKSHYEKVMELARETVDQDAVGRAKATVGIVSGESKFKEFKDALLQEVMGENLKQGGNSGRGQPGGSSANAMGAHSGGASGGPPSYVVSFKY